MKPESLNKPKGEEPYKPETKATLAEAPLSQAVTLVSELDGYIQERMKSQPKDLASVEVMEKPSLGRHRLSLPDYFEQLNYDSPHHGPYVFRWIYKEKRAIDRALNVVGWVLANRTYFPDAPKELFSVSGAIEVGDAVLGFMPVKRALELREKPGRMSREALERELRKPEERPDLFYKPNLGPEESEGEMSNPPGALVEGKDF